MRPNTHHEHQRGNGGRSHWSRHLHRWLGLGSLVFVVLLSVTGVALNHSSGLGMDESHIRWSWLLDWYGIEAPAVESSYAVADHRVTLLGERLYFDQEEIAAGVLGLTGAAAIARAGVRENWIRASLRVGSSAGIGRHSSPVASRSTWKRPSPFSPRATTRIESAVAPSTT